MSSHDPPRRRLLQLIAGGVAVAGAARAQAPAPRTPAPSTPAAQTPKKLTKAAAKYQDKPKQIQMCATCSLFEPPKACQVVEGEVAPKGWCELYAVVD